MGWGKVHCQWTIEQRRRVLWGDGSCLSLFGNPAGTSLGLEFARRARLECLHCVKCRVCCGRGDVELFFQVICTALNTAKLAPFDTLRCFSCLYRNNRFPQGWFFRSWTLCSSCFLVTSRLSRGTVSHFLKMKRDGPSGHGGENVLSSRIRGATAIRLHLHYSC